MEVRRMTWRAFKDYFNVVRYLADWVNSVLDKPFDIREPDQMISFLAFVQHHGFPTPLLDWSLSPYIAAYFAFAQIDDDQPEVDCCAIYMFDHVKWTKNSKPVKELITDTPHLTVLRPKAFGNLRQIHQQGWMYTFTTERDLDTHREPDGILATLSRTENTELILNQPQ